MASQTLDIKKIMETIKGVVWNCFNEIYPWEKAADSRDINDSLKFSVTCEDGVTLNFIVFASKILVQAEDEDIVMRLDNVRYSDFMDVESMFILTHIAVDDEKIIKALKESRAKNRSFKDKTKCQLLNELKALELELMKRYENIDIEGAYADNGRLLKIFVGEKTATINGVAPSEVTDFEVATHLVDIKDDILESLDLSLAEAHKKVANTFELFKKIILEEDEKESEDDDEEVDEEAIKQTAKSAAEAIINIVESIKNGEKEEAEEEEEEEVSQEEKAKKIAKKAKGRKPKKDSDKKDSE